METKHTPGPWNWVIHDHSMASIEGARGMEDHVLSVSPCKSCQEGATQWEFGRCTTPSEANARRIVACVNACEGYENPQLMREHADDNCSMAKTARAALERESRLEPELTRLREENAKLRKDSERLTHLHDDRHRAQAYFWNHQGRHERNAAIDATIAKVQSMSKTPITNANTGYVGDDPPTFIRSITGLFVEAKVARRLETDRARLIEALKETIEEAESGLFRIEGGTDRTSWMCCCECYQAEWKGHKKDCKGALRITRYRALLKEMEEEARANKVQS